MSAIYFVTFDDVTQLIRLAGLGPIRDQGLLESSLHRPRVVLWGQESYPDLFEKAAALLESLARNRALLDGNKRLAWLSMHTFLAMNGFEITSDEDRNLEFMLSCARGDFDLEQITTWLRDNADPL